MLKLLKQFCTRFYILLTFKGKIDPSALNEATSINKDYIKENEVKYQNLIDGAWVEPETDTSNFMAYSRYMWAIEVKYRGYMILAENHGDLEEKYKKIDLGDTRGFYTVEEFNKKFTNIYKEDIDVFIDDVSLMKNCIRQTNYNQDKTHRL